MHNILKEHATFEKREPPTPCDTHHTIIMAVYKNTWLNFVFQVFKQSHNRHTKQIASYQRAIDAGKDELYG